LPSKNLPFPSFSKKGIEIPQRKNPTLKKRESGGFELEETKI